MYKVKCNLVLLTIKIVLIMTTNTSKYSIAEWDVIHRALVIIE
jgi:hypothetical protein